MTGDIPEHLTDAASVAAALAALRPEDAHLIRPALARLAAERDEARAEIERLRESCRDAGTFAKELHAENERLKAENEPTP
mgnify:CR=1 FL=1